MFRRGESYGRVLSTRQWQGPSRLPWWRRWWNAWRWWLALAVLLVGLQYLYGWWKPTLKPLAGTPHKVQQQFHRCGKGRGADCVVDGDTFIMARRHFRILGIDAPEIGDKAHCPLEAQRAEIAANELLRLLNQGPFTLQAPRDGLLDQYGRELMTVTRKRPNGTTQDIAQDLLASGKVHEFGLGKPRGGWC